MGSCCSDDDAMLSTADRTTYSNVRTKDTMVETPDTSHENNIQEDDIDLDISILIAYILSPEFTTFDLTWIWENVDVKNRGDINIKTQLQNIFIAIIRQYVKGKVNDTPLHESEDVLSLALSQHFQTVLSNHGYNKSDFITKAFFVANFKQYLAVENPTSIVGQ
eukprot:128368_1